MKNVVLNTVSGTREKIFGLIPLAGNIDTHTTQERNPNTPLVS